MANPTTSSSSTADATQQEIAKLQEQLQKGTADASGYLDSLKTKLTEFDNSHQLSETASSYFQTAMDNANASVAELKKVGDSMKTKSDNASEAVVASANSSLEQAYAALSELNKSAQAYDDKVRTSINSNVASAKEGSSKTLASWQDSITSLVNATRETTFSGFEAIQNQIAATQKAIAEQAAAAQATVSETAGAVAKQASDATPAATTDKEEAAPTLLQRATGVVTSSVGYVAGAIQNATAAAPQDSTVKKGVDETKTPAASS
ncbi:hypothetical protein BBJ28_00019920 [Nothophytophthora sp. Chile5]|nr:hypothetical protein BBJ28_00019920 [Nothophytophthora sp. Chile5]